MTDSRNADEVAIAEDGRTAAAATVSNVGGPRRGH